MNTYLSFDACSARINRTTTVRYFGDSPLMNYTINLVSSISAPKTLAVSATESMS